MINIIGLGYIGLPTALMFATHGVKVVGTDCNERLIQQLNAGHISFKEEGIIDLLDSAFKEGIRFTTEYQKADVYIIAVPTPYDKKSKKIDPTYIIGALESIMSICPKGAIIVIESTVSPGTIDRFIRPVVGKSRYKLGVDIHIVHAPERIIPGNMVHELIFNSRTIGADELFVAERIKLLYSSFCKGEIVITDIRTAEMTKVVENTYRDVNIAFANELAKICRSDNMDVYEIIRIANKHPRVSIMSPGPGVGGHCIPVDPWFLVGDYPSLVNVILAARNVNDSMPEFILERMIDIMKIHGIEDVRRVGLYGLTYKENVDDTRESPTLQLLDQMEHNLASCIKVYDPFVKENIIENQYHEFDTFIEDIDLVVVMVGHANIYSHAEKLKDKIVFDTRNSLSDGAAKKIYRL
ncbi:MAG: nucleotide sugar dehydrogenase [Saccharofermentanales bacterium]|jgi:UDP-N-acetyl-D-mannosaminuronic acid dehydrogenase|nr:nucleotide sugar dehydrogenase [Bacillota bacterium]NLB08950.1 nucleotide sugar dehydrogenase [Clostridiales bacterium]